jgi:iron complex outermembrane receptor protein
MKSSAFARRLALAASPLALGLALIATPAAAQTTSPEEAPPATTEESGNDAATPAPTEGDEIVVTGFRRSLESAVRTKRDQEQIVESVTAEDIGKLPDNSIGESIARLPGIASQRTNGRANVIAIRGFGPDFSQTLLNGREQTSTNDNRGVEFDQYPGEVVSQVVVYKSPNASLVGQGLVGTVDIRTVRPLDYGRRALAIGLRGSYADLGKLNSGSEDKGYRASATFIDQFADDRIGVSVAASLIDEPYQVQEFNAWGYATGNLPGSTEQLGLIGGSKSYVTSTNLKRFGLNTTVQAELADNLVLTGDFFYSNFEDDQIKRGIELPLGFGAFGTINDIATFRAENGTVVSGTFRNVQGVVRNDVFNKTADLYSGGLNLAWKGDNGWRAFGDASFSRTDREELSIESYSGTGFGEALGATDTISFVTGKTGTVFDPTLNYSDPNLIRLTDPLGWGGGVVPQAGYYNNRILDDELVQLRGEVEREIGGFLDAVKVGVNYTDRTKSLTPDEFLVRLPNGQLEAAIPAGALLSPTNLAYLGLGPIVSYDPRQLIEDGNLVLAPNTSNDIPAKAYNVFEKIWTGYVQANMRGELGAAELTGNVGLQMVHTDQRSTGLAFLNGNRVDVSLGDKFWLALPSMNANLRFPTDFVVRFAASRQIQRPRLDQLRSAIGYGIDQSGGVPIIAGSGGNPTLRPYLANAADLNFEKYFGGTGFVALQLFYKKFTSFVSDGRDNNFDFSAFPLPIGVTPPSRIGRLDAPVNTDGGKMYGAEVAATLPLNVIVDALDGFGLTGGVGYTKTRVKDFNGDRTRIPGYSKWVANGTAFFEKFGFNARGSVRYRSSFLGDFTGFGGSPTRRLALDETIYDAQVGYDFQDGSPLRGLSVYLQGQNLTDERFASVNSNENPTQIIDYQIYGRRFLAGLTFKF